MRRVKSWVNALLHHALVPGLFVALLWYALPLLFSSSSFFSSSASPSASSSASTVKFVLCLALLTAAAALMRWLDRVPKLAIKTGYR